jgi:hypothetical protein
MIGTTSTTSPNSRRRHFASFERFAFDRNARRRVETSESIRGACIQSASFPSMKNNHTTSNRRKITLSKTVEIEMTILCSRLTTMMMTSGCDDELGNHSEPILS